MGRLRPDAKGCNRPKAALRGRQQSVNNGHLEQGAINLSRPVCPLAFPQSRSPQIAAHLTQVFNSVSVTIPEKVVSTGPVRKTGPTPSH